MNCRRNLVARKRAPVSSHDGTMCLGLFRSVQLFLSKPFAASIPACEILDQVFKRIKSCFTFILLRYFCTLVADIPLPHPHGTRSLKE